MIANDIATARPEATTVAQVRLWTLCVVGIGYWANVVRTARHTEAPGLAYVVEGVLQNGAFCVAAWAMIAAWARDTVAKTPATRGQIALAIAVCLVSATPSRQASILGLGVLAWQFWRQSGGAARLGRHMAALLASLALELAWTSIYAMPFHTVIATLDARAVGAVLALGGTAAAVHDNLVANLAGNFQIEVLVRCASSYPLADVCLAYLVVTLYQHRFPRRRDLPWLAASLLASVVLTELRLTWMASREADFTWLHDGGGMTLYTLVALGLGVLFPMLASRAP